MRMPSLTYLLPVLTLTACSPIMSAPDGTTGSAFTQTAEKIAATDDAQCKSLGLRVGTHAYGDCRLRLKQHSAPPLPPDSTCGWVAGEFICEPI
jgi:hypothetical protein